VVWIVVYRLGFCSALLWRLLRWIRWFHVPKLSILRKRILALYFTHRSFFNNLLRLSSIFTSYSRQHIQLFDALQYLSGFFQHLIRLSPAGQRTTLSKLQLVIPLSILQKLFCAKLFRKKVDTIHGDKLFCSLWITFAATVGQTPTNFLHETCLLVHDEISATNLQVQFTLLLINFKRSLHLQKCTVLRTIVTQIYFTGLLHEY